MTGSILGQGGLYKTTGKEGHVPEEEQQTPVDEATKGHTQPSLVQKAKEPGACHQLHVPLTEEDVRLRPRRAKFGAL